MSDQSELLFEDADKIHVNLIGAYAGLLAATEIGLGGLLHSLHIPFGGTFLSLNQIFILTKASLEKEAKHTFFFLFLISFITALMKTLTPIGKKLTPMLAIGMQGLLFNVGILIFGYTTLGRLTGALLSSLWSFIQPFLLYYVIFGHDLFEALRGIVSEGTVYTALFFLVLIKMLLASLIAIFTPMLSESWISSYVKKMSNCKLRSDGKKIVQKPALGALKDLCMPFFVISLLITGLFFFWTEQSYVSLLIHLARPLAMGFIVFYAMRLMPLEYLVGWLQQKKFNKTSSSLKIALDKIRS